MWIPLTLAYLFSLVISLLFTQFHINLFKYPPYLLLPLTLAVFIPISIIFLLPIDYISHNATDTTTWFDVPANVILFLWKSNYWVTFLLTWLILPVLQEYYRSGYFKSSSKLKDAFKKNLKFQLAILAVSLMCLVYLILEVGLTFGHLKLMIIALSHIYALILALWLMAHGMVNIPRVKWVEGNIVNHLNSLYMKVPKLVDSLEDVRIDFKEDVLKVIVLTKNFTTGSSQDLQYRDWILQLYNKIPGEMRESMERQYLHDDSNTISRDQLNEHYMTKLTLLFNLNLYKFVAYESEFETLLVKVTRLEDILNARTNPTLEERNQLRFRLNNYRVLLLPKLNFIYYYYMRPIGSRIASVILFIGSFIIIESEFFHSTKLSLMNVIVFTMGIHKYKILQLIISSVSFSYMLFASLNSLTHLKIFNMYHLVPFQSDPVSASFYTTYIARLTIPLSYNFITLFISRDSIFEEWYGQSIHLTGLFNLLNNWLPRFVLIPVVLTTFNVYDRVKKRLGLTSDFYGSWASFDDDDQEEDVENLQNKRKDLVIVEAKRIINREMTKRQQTGRVDSDLRPFNLANAANEQYNNNRRAFNESLAANTRIDAPYYDDVNNIQNEVESASVFGRIGGAWDSIKNSVTGRFSSNYRDEVEVESINDFNYDDDANENLVL
ncbi:uncharacterized protein CANTADRAFT_61307 [Suhomyces tanzawaensis NRRL Y-17324]|uniref:LMBR1-domain-containing protein n=1 Tax=Suhomyces tanzawaensis NRRL Y-17324 TaxID=984487 RepID=A0A1E4SM51_9ASCO|nr:uncharacterized protein CANTADRAFT_61307 [Suhomyces tanzawaensis NRRL Y-17324]ODV80568.1 hypothetical protein CANTADRAFT_61307 [Suhomyces tanzawaensis NRRL Y-17324]